MPIARRAINATLAGSVFVVWALACAGGPRDDRPIEVKAAADKSAAVAGGMSNEATARAAYLGRIQLRSIKASPSNNSLTDGRKAIVEGEVKNTGDESIDEVQITVYFLDSNGKRVHEATYYPVLASNIFSTDKTPLKANYARKFAAALDVPSDWAGSVEVKVTDVKFSAQADKP